MAKKPMEPWWNRNEGSKPLSGDGEHTGADKLVRISQGKVKIAERILTDRGLRWRSLTYDHVKGEMTYGEYLDLMAKYGKNN